MKILAIETSCDETAIALAEFSGRAKTPRVRVRSHLVSSQAKLHAKFGGVVPNLAKREHQKNLVPILIKVLAQAGSKTVKRKAQNPKPQPKTRKIERILEREPELLKHFKKSVLPLTPPDIDAIAVTYGPGLAPALWVGINFARALGCLWNKPLIPVNHMEGHLYSALLQKSGIEILKFNVASLKFPALALLVSGGHTELVLMRGHGKFKIIGETRDDAAGEAFDKVARILGLEYPGGPHISRLAQKGDPRKYPLPSPMINTKDYDFSFSGLKTAVLYLMRDLYSTKYSTKIKADMAASFEKAAVDVLVKKTVRAAKEYQAKSILLGGGVAASQALRAGLQKEIKNQIPGTKYLIPDTGLTGDNALMIAAAAYFSKKKMAWSETLQADANVKL